MVTNPQNTDEEVVLHLKEMDRRLRALEFNALWNSSAPPSCAKFPEATKEYA